jgi:hypothetical protein
LLLVDPKICDDPTMLLDYSPEVSVHVYMRSCYLYNTCVCVCVRLL